MNHEERRVLKMMKGEILANLVLENCVLDTLEQADTLTEDMAHRIKAKSTNGERIEELLYILPRRGPEAFTTFIQAITPTHGFLADMLLDKLQSENTDNDAESCDSNKTPDSIQTTSSDARNGVLDTNNNKTTNQSTTHNSGSNQSQQRNNNHSDYSHATINQWHPTEEFKNKMVQEWLNGIYTKLKNHLTNKNLRELSFKSPEPVSFEMVERLIDDMIQEENKCYRALGNRDRNSSIFTQILSIKDQKKKLKTDLKETEDQKNKYAANIIKLENRCRSIQVEAENFRIEKERLYCETIILKEKIQTKTSEVQAKVDEKQIEIMQLKSEISELRKEIEQIMEEKVGLQEDNDHLRQEVHDLQGRHYRGSLGRYGNTPSDYHGYQTRQSHYRDSMSPQRSSVSPQRSSSIAMGMKHDISNSNSVSVPGANQCSPRVRQPLASGFKLSATAVVSPQRAKLTEPCDEPQGSNDFASPAETKVGKKKRTMIQRIESYKASTTSVEDRVINGHAGQPSRPSLCIENKKQGHESQAMSSSFEKGMKKNWKHIPTNRTTLGNKCVPNKPRPLETLTICGNSRK